MGATVNSIVYAVERGRINNICNAHGTNQPNYSRFDIGNWRYYHLHREEYDNDNLWQVISDNRNDRQNDIIILREIKLDETTNQERLTTTAAYSPTPRGMYGSDVFVDPITNDEVTIVNTVPEGTAIGRVGPFYIVYSNGTRRASHHLHLQSLDGWTNPLSRLPRVDSNTDNIALTPGYRQVGTTELQDFPSNNNHIYGDIMLHGEYNSNIEHDFNKLTISFKTSGETEYAEFFNWQYSGTGHMEMISRSEGTSETLAHNVHTTPVGNNDVYITLDEARNDIREGVFPLSSTVYSHELLKKKWESNSLISSNPHNPEYPDGRYNILFRATDLTNHNTDRNINVILDNHFPHIEKVEVRSENINSRPFHTSGWYATGNELNFDTYTSGIGTDNQILWIRVITSEPMESLSLSINGGSAINKSDSDDSAGKVWDFKVLSNATKTGTNTLSISGQDLAGHQLQTNPDVVTIRNEDGTWPNTATLGADTNHEFELYSFLSTVADFTVTQINGYDGREVQFTNTSYSPNQLNVFEWREGSNTFSTIENPEHLFTSLGDKYVTLTVKENTTSTPYTKTKVVKLEDITLPNANFDVGMVPGEDDEVIINLVDKSTGIIGTWDWTIKPVNSPKNMLKSSGSTFNLSGKNPRKITLDANTHYNVLLRVSNKAGSDTKENNDPVFFDKDSSPYAGLLAYRVSDKNFRFSADVWNLDGPYTYEIDFGDGTSYTETSVSSVYTIEHDYALANTYYASVTVTGYHQDTGELISCSNQERIWVTSVTLDFDILSDPASNIKEDSPTNFYFNVSNPSNTRTYNWQWSVYKGTYSEGDKAIAFDWGYSKLNSKPGLFTYKFEEPGQYEVLLYLSDDESNGLQRKKITVNQCPKFLDADITNEKDIPDEVMISSKYTFNGYLMYKGGAPSWMGPEHYEPNKIRWTIIHDNKVEYSNTYNYKIDDVRTHLKDITFSKSGIYTVRLEGWNDNHGYNENNLKPSNCVSFYNYAEKEIVVNGNYAIIDANASYYYDYLGLQLKEIKISNLGEKDLNWKASLKSNSNFEILESSRGKNNGSILVESVSSNSNLEDNIEYLTITCDDAVNSPYKVKLIQNGNERERFEHVIDAGIHASSGDNFGYSVDIYGNYAAVGAPGNDKDKNGSTVTNCGSVFIFEKQYGAWGDWAKWKLIKKINPEISKKNRNFGSCVSLSENFLAVTSYGHNLNEVVTVFKKPQGGWKNSIEVVSFSHDIENLVDPSVSIWDNLPNISNFYSGFFDNKYPSGVIHVSKASIRS